MVKKVTAKKKAAARPVGGSYRLVRLSDPEMKGDLDKTVATLTRRPSAALKFLQEMGIATPSGRLTKRYGG